MEKITNIQFYEPVWGSYFPDSNYFYREHNFLPNTVRYEGNYSLGLVDKLLTEGLLTHLNNKVTYYADGTSLSVWVLESKSYVPLLVTLMTNSGGEYVDNVNILYKNYEDITKVKEIIESHSTPKNIGKISIIIKDEFGLDLKEYETKYLTDVEIETNYNDDFKPIHDKIIKRLNTKHTSGLVLLHGKPGTGKTTYIKGLTHFLDSKVIFIPPFMVKVLADPGFIPFLMKHPNSILVIEDAENVILDRSSSSDNDAISNILNITDGILGDCINVKIIATFNIEKTRIDKALLRKGRLIAEYEFKELSTEKTNNILNKIHTGVVSERGLTLSDIYNYDDTVGLINGENKIGF